MRTVNKLQKKSYKELQSMPIFHQCVMTLLECIFPALFIIWFLLTYQAFLCFPEVKRETKGRGMILCLLFVKQSHNYQNDLFRRNDMPDIIQCFLQCQVLDLEYEYGIFIIPP